MFHDLSANIIEDVLVVAISWEDVLPTNHSVSGSDVLQLFVDTNVNTINTKVLKIKRETNEGCCSFLKTFDGKEVDLFKKLVIQFEGEEGIDVGAFTVEYVTKFFEIFRRDLFGAVESRTILIANGSAGNLILFKILGIAIEASLLQGGLHFLIYTPDDTLS